MLPAEIPDHLRALASETEFGGSRSGAWPRDIAIEVIESLEGTWIVVIGAVVCGTAVGAVPPLTPSWEFKPVFGESAADRARRSREGATLFVKSLPESDETRVALDFSSQDEAA